MIKLTLTLEDDEIGRQCHVDVIAKPADLKRPLSELDVFIARPMIAAARAHWQNWQKQQEAAAQQQTEQPQES